MVKLPTLYIEVGVHKQLLCLGPRYMIIWPFLEQGDVNRKPI